MIIDNHISPSLSTSELEKPRSLGLSDSVIEGIPEEKAVDIGETPYMPLQSPAREDLPPLPGAVSTNGEELVPAGDIDAPDPGGPK